MCIPDYTSESDVAVSTFAASESVLTHAALSQLHAKPRLAAVAVELLWAANRAASVPAFLNQGVSLIAQTVGADFAAVAVAQQGTWSVAAKAGVSRPLRLDLLASVLDRETAEANGDWLAAPLGQTGGIAEVLVVHLGMAVNDRGATNETLSSVAVLAQI